MPTAPDQDLVTLLDANVVDLTENTNLFVGKMIDAGSSFPAKAVACLATGGPAPQAYLLGGTGTERRFSAVQVSVRSNPEKYNEGLTLARSVRDTIHHATISGYIDIRVNESEPNYLGQEDGRSHLWTINAELWHEQ